MTSTATPPRTGSAPPPTRRPAVPVARSAPLPAVRGMSREDRRAAAAAAVAVVLGSFSLVPVFTTMAWLRPVLLVVLAVWGGGLLMRRAAPAIWDRATRGAAVAHRVEQLGIAAVPLVQFGLVACVLTALYAPDDAWSGLVPTPTSVARLNSVLLDGLAELQEQATPALPLTGLLALTAVLVGLIAVVVDFVAVAWRQGALAGLGLLALSCVPVSTITGGIGLVALLAPAIGFALLLWADQRRRLAGRDRPTARAGIGPGARVGLRIALLAMATGVAVGAVLPTLPEGSFGTGLGAGSGGGSTGTALDPVAALQGQLTRPEPLTLLRVEADVPDLGHLRAVSLDRYDTDGGWTISNLDSEMSVAQPSLAPLPPAQLSREVNARITSSGHDDRFMPVPWAPQQVFVPDPENWRYDPSTSTVFGRETTTGQRTWFVTALQPEPSPALLQAAPALDPGDPVQQRFTQLPELDPAVTTLVGEVTAGAGTPYERVRRINDFLTDRTNGFVYSLSTAPGTSDDDLVNFLKLRRGYCEQYAGAMAVMVRSVGVPARMVLGYTPGQLQSDGSRLITTDDAHAWVEVYFAGLGWVPFDPTPIAPGRAVDLPWAPRAADQQPDTPTGSDPTTQPQTAPTPRADRGDTVIPDFTPSTGSGDWRTPLLVALGIALAAAVVVAVPASVRSAQRRRRLADGRAGVLWDELDATVRDLRLPLDPAGTPRQTARRLSVLAGHAPDPLLAAAADDALRRLAHAEEAASYGPVRAEAPDATRDDEQAAQLAADLRTARRALTRSVARPTRLRALLWPTSLVTAAIARVRERAAQVTGFARSSRPA